MSVGRLRRQPSNLKEMRREATYLFFPRLLLRPHVQRPGFVFAQVTNRSAYQVDWMEIQSLPSYLANSGCRESNAEAQKGTTPNEKRSY